MIAGPAAPCRVGHTVEKQAPRGAQSPEARTGPEAGGLPHSPPVTAALPAATCSPAVGDSQQSGAVGG